MMAQYLPIVLLLVLAVVFGVAQLRRLATAGAAPAVEAKEAPYECGIVPVDGAAGALPGQLLRRRHAVHHVRHRDHLRLPVRRVARRASACTGSWAIVIFSALFFLTFVYEVARGGLDWGPLQRGPRDLARPRAADRPSPCRRR